ncbi:hypothetical protein RISK_002658 [Rhodopirellula islandica]|uniref:Uncharacterized protein n=1 Tax=Rhodopirellula islandica TaxID=595434 RepID=A0A0J1BFH0_RHOIS|nr:hypothetical protein RISK_002658 [Rhodopirellula islandica]
MSRAKSALRLACLVVCLGMSGCGGDETPPPLGEELQQQIEQEDKQIANEESAL